MGDDNKELEVNVPQYFLCPISLQIMKDPVTASTGITYDRHFIEQWLTTTASPAVCPVTKQPLLSHHLTPNLTLRRLIHSWCSANSAIILRCLTLPSLRSASLDHLLSLTSTSSDLNLVAQCDCGVVVQALVSIIVGCHKATTDHTTLEKAMRVLNAVLTSSESYVADNYYLVDAVTWVLNENDDDLRVVGILLMKDIVKVTSSNLLERLKPEFFKAMVNILMIRASTSTNKRASTVGPDLDLDLGPVKAALRVLLEVCKYGRNRQRMIEANAAFQLIELELELGLGQLEKTKKVSEMVFCLLGQLCSCADGRAQFLGHSGGVAVVAKRMLRVSAVVDDRAVHVLGQITKFAGTKEVLEEMLKVGAVAKLCMVLQTYCAKYLKDKVRDMLRVHSCVWKDSPCVQLNLLNIRYPV